MNGGNRRRMMIVRAVNQQPALGGFRDERRAFHRKVNAEHQPFSAHLAYKIKFCG